MTMTNPLTAEQLVMHAIDAQQSAQLTQPKGLQLLKCLQLQQSSIERHQVPF